MSFTDESIPEIDTSDRRHIRPIYDGRLLENVDPMIAYQWAEDPETIPMPPLRKLATFDTLHLFWYRLLFKPTVDEVWRQIPKEFVKEAYAFEITGHRWAADPELHLATCTLYALE